VLISGVFTRWEEGRDNKLKIGNRFFLRVFGAVGILVYVGATCLAKYVMKITSIVRFGVVALAMGAFSGVGLPVRADQVAWVRAQQLDFWRARGLVPPGSYSQSENQKPATIAVSKAGQGVGEQKQTTSKPEKKGTQHVRSAHHQS
jgi:hypothetical protein